MQSALCDRRFDVNVVKGAIATAIGLLLVLPILLLTGCGEENPVAPTGNESIVLGQLTHLITPDDTLYLRSVSVNLDTIVFASAAPLVSVVKPNDIIMNGWAHNGFLCRVLSVRFDQGQAIYQTQPVALDEAIKSGRLYYSGPATFPDSLYNYQSLSGVLVKRASGTSKEISVEIPNVVIYDQDHSPLTTDDRITIDGSLTLSIDQITFECVLDGISLRKFEYGQVISLSPSVRLASAGKAKLSGEALDMELLAINSSPIPISLTPPIYIVPRLYLCARVEGSINGELSLQFGLRTTNTVDIKFQNGSWTPATDQNTSFDTPKLDWKLGVSAKAGVGPRISVLLMGVTGISAKVLGFGEAEVTPLQQPTCKVYVGGDLTLSVLADVFGHEVFKYDLPHFVYRELIWQYWPADVYGLVVDASSGLPLANASVELYGLSMNTMTDDTGGYAFHDVPEGTQYVRATQQCFTTMTHQIRVTSGTKSYDTLRMPYVGPDESCTVSENCIIRYWPSPEQTDTFSLCLTPGAANVNVHFVRAQGTQWNLFGSTGWIKMIDQRDGKVVWSASGGANAYILNNFWTGWLNATRITIICHTGAGSGDGFEIDNYKYYR